MLFSSSSSFGLSLYSGVATAYHHSPHLSVFNIRLLRTNFPISSFTTSKNLLFGLRLLLFPGNHISIIFLLTYSWSLLMTCSYHLSLPFLIIFIPNRSTQNIEDSFEAKKKAGAVFIDLTAAYDTVWHRGLICKLLRLLPDKHMVKMIMELVRNRSFTPTTDNSKQSRLRRLKNGVPQRSVLVPLLFNIYTYDLPSMISRKFAYADDLALLHSSGNWKDLKGILSQDMSTLSAYLQTWRLKLSHTKTVTAAFHLNNREAKRELKVYNNGRLLPFCPTPTYLGVKLDRSLTFRHHLVALRKKLSSRVTLLRRLVG